MSALTLGMIAAFAWALHDICVRYLSQKTPLMASLLTVLVVALGFEIGLMVVTKSTFTLPSEAFWISVVSGFFFIVASLGLYAAFHRGPVRLVAPIIAAYPVLSVGWAVFRGADVSWLQWVAVLLIIAGVSVVAALADHGEEDVAPKGPTILFSLIAAIGFAGTFALGQYAAETAGHMPVTLVTRITAIALLVAGMAIRRLPFWAGKKAIPMLVVMGTADGIALACVLSAGGLPDAQYAAVAASCFGLLTIVLAWAILRERMTPLQWFGCALAFGGIGYLAL